MMTDSRYKKYKVNEDCIILKDGLLFRKHFGETGIVKYNQILIPKQLFNEVVLNLHGEFGKHRGIAKTIIAYREKCHFPKKAQLIREWVMSCEQCLRKSRTNRRLTHPPLQNTNQHFTVTEDAMRMELAPELPPSGSFEKTAAAM